ncbi:hypothetical protein [Microbacterium azadirachtae]|uniref:CU044_5270 family protein n=1 Tax=Microbacterium azadirachtae TaxID=582680 RepID=A0A0F0LR24_9MICO|nr:hypothetical protein [Microbacterium azadirachtae]KJL34685.1 hypothetical protein RS86_00738 [Microbacterium azadirachtae]
MPLTDELFGTLIREADPASTPLDSAPSAEDWALLRRMMDAPSTASPVRSSPERPVLDRIAAIRRTARTSRPLRIALRTAWIAPALAAIIAVGLAIGPMTAAPAYAVTPPVLVAQPIPQTADEVLNASIATLQGAQPRTPTRDAQVVGWALRDDGNPDPVITPVWQKWVWDADGTGHLESQAGAPYSVTADGKIVAPATEAPKEGSPTELPRQSSAQYFAEPPAEPTALRAYIAHRIDLPTDADPMTVWGAISAIRDEWALSPAQQAAALQLLRDAGGVSVLGTVTDRLGRSGIALKIASTKRPQFTATVVLDAGTREIIAADTIYQGGSTMKLKIAPGSVIEYKAWLSR